MSSRSRRARPGKVAPDFLVVGLGRSGTSLLMAMLDAHPDVVVLPDTGGLRGLVRQAPWAIAAALGGTGTRAHGSRGGLDMGFARFAERILRDVPPRAVLVGEKTPAHLEFVLAAGAAWPETKFVEIRRDGRGILASRKRAPWTSERSLLWHLLAMRTHQRLGVLGEAILRSRYLVLRYEDLVTRPRAELTRVARFLGAEPHDSMLRYQANARRLLEPRERGWKSGILNAPDPSRQEVWRNELSPFEQRAVTLAMGDRMEISQALSRAGALALLARWTGRFAVLAILVLSLTMTLPVFPRPGSPGES